MEIKGLSGVHQGQTIPVNGSVVFGRNPQSCTVVFPDKTKGISRLHCKVDAGSNGCIITDLGSTYGTFVNGRKLPANVPTPINNGDSFYVGDQSNMFAIAGTGSINHEAGKRSSTSNRARVKVIGVIAACLVVLAAVLFFAFVIHGSEKYEKLDGTTWKIAEAPGTRITFAENGDLLISEQGEFGFDGSFSYSPAGDKMIMVKYTAPPETTGSDGEVNLSLFSVLGGGVSTTQSVTSEYTTGCIWKFEYDKKTDTVKITDVNDYDLFTLKKP